MVFRLVRVRLRGEWLLSLIALGLIVLYVFLCGSEVRSSTDLYSYNQFDFGAHTDQSSFSDSGFRRVEADLALVARANGVDPRDLPPGADLHDVYRLAILAQRDLLYNYIMNFGVISSLPVLAGLAMLLLCPLFRKRRFGQYLSAGYSRKQVFLAFTLVYFCCALLMFGLASLYWLTRFHISYPPGEAGGFLRDQLGWLCFLLMNAALAYLAALFLPRPILAFIACIVLWFPLLFLYRGLLNASPVVNIAIALVLLAGVVAAAWRQFRKRGFAA